MRVCLRLASCVPLILFIAACAAAPAGVQVIDPWVRAAVTLPASNANDHGMAMDHGGGNSAAYLTLRGGRVDDRLLRVTSEIATVAEIHETQRDGDVMRMRPLPAGLDIPAGGQVELAPGGYHIMLMGLRGDLNAGDQVILTLHFAQAGAVEVQAAVRMP